MADAAMKRALGVGWQTFEGVAVLLNPTRDLVHELNGSATWLWERLDGKRTEQELAIEMTEAFDVDEQTALGDVAAFRVELTELALLDAPT